MEYNIRSSNHIIGSDFPALAWMRLDDNSPLEICRTKYLRNTMVDGHQGPWLRHEQRLGISSLIWDILGETFLAIFFNVGKTRINHIQSHNCWPNSWPFHQVWNLVQVLNRRCTKQPSKSPVRNPCLPTCSDLAQWDIWGVEIQNQRRNGRFWTPTKMLGIYNLHPTCDDFKVFKFV